MKMESGKWKGICRLIVFFVTIIMIIGLSFILSLKDKSNNNFYGDNKQKISILSDKIENNVEDKKIESGREDNFEREIITGLVDYKNKGNENVAQNDIEEDETTLICYLTFDDGPSYSITPQILDVLKNQGVKATFFVIGSLAEENSNIVKKAFDEGHYIANHTYSHKYNEIYSNEESFIEEVKKGAKVIKDITGHETNLFRFPGGSFGKAEYIELIESNGYDYVDWNALNGDAESLNVSEYTMMKKLKESMYGQNPLIVLMHDAATKQTTVDALPEIIRYISEQGYEFSTMEKWKRK